MKNTLWPAFFSMLLLCNSCVTYNSLVNYETGNPDKLDGTQITNYQPLRIQSNDILSIRVGSREDPTTLPFQAPDAGAAAVGGGGGQNLLMTGYLVSSAGTIDFPTLGTMRVDGLTLTGVRDLILSELESYFTTLPLVDVRLLNFAINVNGEVSSPGRVSVQNERITALEAINLSGDFTSYSRRDSVMVIRESGGIRSVGYLDFNEPEVFLSPYFYLQQNDMIYVRPMRRKTLTVQDPVRRILTYVSAVTGTVAFLLALANRD